MLPGPVKLSVMSVSDGKRYTVVVPDDKVESYVRPLFYSPCTHQLHQLRVPHRHSLCCARCCRMTFLKIKRTLSRASAVPVDAMTLEANGVPLRDDLNLRSASLPRDAVIIMRTAEALDPGYAGDSAPSQATSMDGRDSRDRGDARCEPSPCRSVCLCVCVPVCVSACCLCVCVCLCACASVWLHMLSCIGALAVYSASLDVAARTTSGVATRR